MTQASLAPRPVSTDPLRATAADDSSEPAEDPDSPGPETLKEFRGVDPWAEPMAGLLGTALAVLSLGVPLLAVLGEGQDALTRPAYTLERLHLERTDHQAGDLERIHHGSATGGTTRP